MTALPPGLRHRIDLLGRDRTSGASDILDEVIRLLRDGRAAAIPMVPIARALCRAQPSMASVWNAALEAVAAEPAPEYFEQFARRVARSADALARFGAAVLTADDRANPLRLVTLSFSRSVAIVIQAVHRSRPVHVSCSESRPALEGRRLAAQLAAARIPVTGFGDAAIAHALTAADAVLVGADAVSAEWFLNKSGTRMLAAAAAQQGVPVYVVAARDKFVRPSVANRLVIREGDAAEIWSTAPAGVQVQNPYFEPTPLDLVTSIVSDIGVIGAGMVADVCDTAPDWIAELDQSPGD